MLRKKSNGVATAPRLASAFAGAIGDAVDRRAFLKGSGLVAGGVATASAFKFGMVKKARAQSRKTSGDIKKVLSVCTHCSVGCAVTAEVQGGVWIGQEPSFWIFAGVLVWTSFAECVSRASTAFLEHRNLVQRSSFPADLLVLQPVLTSFATFAVGAAVFLSVAWFVAGTHPSLGHLAQSGILIALHLAWTLGLGLAFAAAQVVLRDTASLVGVTLTVWMFITPIFWVADPAALPAIEPWLTWIEANPMHSLTEAWRWVLLGESAAPFARAELSADLIRFAPWALGALCLGLGSARALRAQLSDEVAA